MDSFWLQSTNNCNRFRSLKEDISADVCIIGGGIFGITSAYYLNKRGFKTVVLEKDRIAENVTGHTTAKITSQHGLIYKYLIDSFGKDFAKRYLEANENAINEIETIIKTEEIECNFERQDSYVYTTDGTEVEKIRQESEALESIGFDSKVINKTGLPFEVWAAIKFPNQAQFNAVKYVRQLAQRVVQNSGKIYTNTLVTDIKKKGNEYEVFTQGNNTVNAKFVVIASHYPFIDKHGYYFLKMYQSTSYVIAVDTKRKKLFDGMYINTKDPIFSYRFVKDGDKKILLVGGSDCKTGSKIDLSNAYLNLEKEVKKYYPKSEVLYRWNTEDCITLDCIPYIGEFSKFMPNVYIGTGFNKWGMTSSNVAANIITDKIVGISNKYEDIFKATRFHPIKNNKNFGELIKETANSLVINKFKVKKMDLQEIKVDSGAVLTLAGKKVGVYKNKKGEIFAVKPICTHLGCLLSFNNIDKTWDCPCHGSRFDYTGKAINNPAIKDLERIELMQKL